MSTEAGKKMDGTITLDREKGCGNKWVKVPDPSLCIQCGTCTASCASGFFTSLRTMRIVRLAQLRQIEAILEGEDLWMCTTCYSCSERCPREVDVPGIIYRLRNMAAAAGFMADAHRAVAANLVRFGHMVPLDAAGEERRLGLGLSVRPPSAQFDPVALAQVKAILERTGFLRLLNGEGKD